MTRNPNSGIDGNRVRILREKQGWTQFELAEKVECSMVYIALIEGGSKKGSFNMLFKLKDIFGVSFDYLLGA